MERIVPNEMRPDVRAARCQREWLPDADAHDGRRVLGNQHRLVCRRCGRTEAVGCANGDQPCLAPAGAAGFRVDEAEVVFLGLCPACKT
jgi:Fe2+ or Zn2+ uptake regulation protein